MKETFALKRRNEVWYGINCHTENGLFIIGVFDYDKLKKYIMVNGFYLTIYDMFGDTDSISDGIEHWNDRHMELLKKHGFKKVKLSKKMDDKLFNILYNNTMGKRKPDKVIQLKPSKQYINALRKKLNPVIGGKINTKPLVKLMTKYSAAVLRGLKATLKYKLDITPEIIKRGFSEVTCIDPNGKTFTSNIIILGHYNKKANVFTWFGDTNVIMQEFIEKSLERNRTKWNNDMLSEYFKPVVSISFKDHATIPYFVSAFQGANSLIKMIGTDKYIILYALMPLHLENPINFDKFTDDLGKIL